MKLIVMLGPTSHRFVQREDFTKAELALLNDMPVSMMPH